MASTAHSDPEMMKERSDPPHILDRKIAQLVQLLQSSRHAVVFTGAGISTNAGIPDFRGPKGKWTLEAKGQKCVSKVRTISALPTATHMALVKLQEQGVVKYLISQNCDGLHRRSGIPAAKISELHGNSNVEKCEDCGVGYFRDLSCHRALSCHDHFTGRLCTCGGRLLESTIDFGQNLPEAPLEKAYAHSEKADLHIAMGSSLTVSPANTLPETTAERGGRLVIINKQKTPLTGLAHLQIYADVDVVMRRVMAQLHLDIPPFRLRRRVLITKAAECDSLRRAIEAGRPEKALEIRPVDTHDCHLDSDFLRKVHIKQTHIKSGDPKALEFDISLGFAGHYREPEYSFGLDLSKCDGDGKQGQQADIRLTYDPFQREWSHTLTWHLPKRLSAAEQQARRDTRYGENHYQYCVAGMRKRGHSAAKAKKIVDFHFKDTKNQVLTKRKPKASFVKWG